MGPSVPLRALLRPTCVDSQRDEHLDASPVPGHLAGSIPTLTAARLALVGVLFLATVHQTCPSVDPRETVYIKLIFIAMP